MKTTTDPQTSATPRKLTPQEVLADWQVRSVQERSSETSTRRHGLPDQAKWHEGKADALDFCALQLEYVVFPNLIAVEHERDALLAERDALRDALSSGLCSRHRTPDPLHCRICNAVDGLTSAIQERMKQIDALRTERNRLRQALERIEQWQGETLPVINDEVLRASAVRAFAREALGAKEDRT